MKRTIAIKNVNIMYRDPIIKGVVERLSRKLGVPEDTYIGLLNDGRQQDSFSDMSNLTFSINEQPKIVRHPRVGYNKTLPLIYDEDVGFRVVPNYVPTRVTINIIYEQPSKTLIKLFQNNIRNLLRNGNVFSTYGTGDFLLGELPVSVLENINEIKNERNGTTKTIHEYVNELKTDRLTVKTGLATAEALVAEEVQTDMNMEFERPISNSEYDKDSKIHSLEFSFVLDMQLPKTLMIEYQGTVHNKYLNDEFLPKNPELTKSENYVYYKNVLLKVIKLADYPTWTVTNGVIDNGVLHGKSIPGNFTGSFIDAIDFDFSTTEFYNGYVNTPGILNDMDIGFLFHGFMEDIPPYINTTLNVIGGVIQNEPLIGQEIESKIDIDIDVTIINNVIYGGDLDQTVVPGFVGGIIIEGTIVGGQFNMSPAPFDIRDFHLITDTYDSEFNITGIFETIQPEIRQSKDRIAIHSNPFMSLFKENKKRSINLKDLANQVVNVPFYDTFKPDTYDEYRPFISILICVSDYDKSELFKINELGLYAINQKLLDVLVEHGTTENINGLGDFPITFVLYVDGKKSGINVLFNNSNMSLTTEEPMDIMRTYRLVMAVSRNNTYFNKELIEKTIHLSGEQVLVENTFNGNSLIQIMEYVNPKEYPFRISKNSIAILGGSNGYSKQGS